MIYSSYREPVRTEASVSLQALDKAEQVRSEAEGWEQWRDPGGPVQWEHSHISHRESPVSVGDPHPGQ